MGQDTQAIGAMTLRLRAEGRQIPRFTGQVSDDVKCEPEKQAGGRARAQPVERVLSWELEPHAPVGLSELVVWRGMCCCFLSLSVLCKMRMAMPGPRCGLVVEPILEPDFLRGTSTT